MKHDSTRFLIPSHIYPHIISATLLEVFGPCGAFISLVPAVLDAMFEDFEVVGYQQHQLTVGLVSSYGMIPLYSLDLN